MTEPEVVAATEDAPVDAPAPEPETPAAAPTLHESVEAAYNAHAEKAEGKSEPKKGPIVTHKPAVKVKVAEHVRTIRPGEKAAANGPGEGVAKPGEGAEAIKPPANWTAQEREHWGKIPPEAQKAVLRAERAAAILVQKTKEDAKKQLDAAGPSQKFVSMFAEAVKPFQHVLKAEGSNPIQAFSEYLRTATVLRQGAPQMKANLIAGLIHNFGVPIEPLATAIDALAKGGQAPTVTHGNIAPAQRQVDPESLIAEAMKRFEAKQSERENASRLSTTTESIEEFGTKKEFFNDVRQDMADILELHLARMRRLPPEQHVALELDDVYDRACRSNPEVSAVYLQRKAAEEAQQRAPALQATKRAASSIRSKPSGINGLPRKTSSNDPRDAAEAAYESLMGGG